MKKKPMKKKQTETINIRCWAEVFIVLGILSMIVVNSLYLDGYVCSENPYEYGALIAGSNGYTAENNTFHYTGDEGSYVQIYASDSAEQLMLVFADQAEKDINVIVDYVDQAGNVMDIVSQGTWKKGDYTVKIDMKEGEFNSYLLIIPCDFTLNEAYYAQDNGYEGSSKVMWMLAALFLVVILTVVIMCVRVTASLVGRVDQIAATKFQKLWENKKEVGKKAIFYGIILLLGVLVAYLGSFSGRYSFSGKVGFLAFLMSGILAIFIVNYKKLAQQIEWVGFFVILLTGSMFAFLSPANVGVSWDDEIHFRNAVQLSHILDKQISAADAAIIGDYTGVALEKRYYNRIQQKSYNQIMDELESAKYYVDSEEMAGISAYAAYLPSAIGLLIARGLGLPFAVRVVIGRWMNTLFLAVMSFFAMKKLQSGKIIVLLIALLPTNIFIAGNYTYDTWLTAWSILGLSTFFGEWQQPNKKIDTKTIWLVGISMYLAVLPKQVYFPLTLIALFLPASKFRDTKQCWFYRGIILAAAVFPFLTVYLQNIANGMGSGEVQGDIRGGESVDAAAQLEFARNYPGQVAKVMYQFLKVYLNPIAWGKEYMTNMAYFGYSPMNANFLLGVIVAGALISRKEKETRFPWWSKAGVLLVYVTIGFIAAFSMYVVFTAVASATVAGCQGRYLMPALFPVLYICSRFSFKTWVKNAVREENINIILLTILVIGSVWGLWTGCLSLY